MTGPDHARPVVALDIDGVLNPFGEVEWHVATPLRVAADRVPASPFLRGYGRLDLEVTVRLNPAHGEWITRLVERAQVVWATTWEHLANEVVAPLLGIEPLEVATSVADYPPRSEYAGTRDSAAWKAEVLVQRYPGRPLVWVDDAASAYRTLDKPDADNELEEQDRPTWPTDRSGTDYEARRRRWRHPLPTLVLVPDPTIGLTVSHQDAVEAFITAHG